MGLHTCIVVARFFCVSWTFLYLLYKYFCVVSAEDYDESNSHISLEDMSDRRAVFPGYAQGQGQGRRQGESHVKTVKERFIRPSHYVPNYRRQMRFDYDILAP